MTSLLFMFTYITNYNYIFRSYYSKTVYMDRQRRLTAVQALHMLQQIADDESGDNNDSENFDEDCSETIEQNSTIDSDGNEDRASDDEIALDTDDDDTQEEQNVAGSSRLVGQGRGRGMICEQRVGRGVIRGRGAVRGRGGVRGRSRA